MNSILLSQSLQSVASKLILGQTTCVPTFSNPTCLQFVRWRKKPRWLPMAKTKMYKVPPRKRYPEEEKKEVLRLFNNYRTSMKAIRYYLSEKTKSQTTAPEVIAEQVRLEQEEHKRCMALNDEWNSAVAKIREERVAKEWDANRLQIVEAIERMKIEEDEEMNRIENYIRSEKEISKTFITPENIDEAIEKVLNSTVDYNYCIDLNGNIYKGLRARPGITEPEKHDISDVSDVKQAVNQ